MTATTITSRAPLRIADIEVVTLTVTDGETFTSEKFATIIGAVITCNADDDGAVNVTFSGNVATINAAGMTDKLMTLVLFGNLGN